MTTAEPLQSSALDNNTFYTYTQAFELSKFAHAQSNKLFKSKARWIIRLVLSFLTDKTAH